MSKDNTLILKIWLYGGEYIATSLIYLFLFLVFYPSDISSFIVKASGHIFSKFTYLMLGVSIGFYWTFYKQSESDFSKWLYEKNAHGTYSSVFLTTIAIYFSTLVLVSITDLSKNNYIAFLTGWFIILASINVFTFFHNIKKLLELMVFFNSKVNKNG